MRSSQIPPPKAFAFITSERTVCNLAFCSATRPYTPHCLLTHIYIHLLSLHEVILVPNIHATGLLLNHSVALSIGVRALTPYQYSALPQRATEKRPPKSPPISNCLLITKTSQVKASTDSFSTGTQSWNGSNPRLRTLFPTQLSAKISCRPTPNNTIRSTRPSLLLDDEQCLYLL